ncbi:MAG TPA: hypothetical protein VGJ00_07515 [Rhabdochlamydiaceae bacterium]|jgi:hypothetical protein
MADSINTPRFPSDQPHGYYSDLSQPLSIPKHIQAFLSDIQEHLGHISKQATRSEPNARRLAESFKNLDTAIAHFSTALHNEPNRGLEKGMHDTFTGVFSVFLDELNSITWENESLRDVLYDSQKLQKFLGQLSEAPSGKDEFRYIAQCSEQCSQEIAKVFRLPAA